MTYCVTRCRAENDVTFNGCVTWMLISKVLSVGSGTAGRWVIMFNSLVLANRIIGSLVWGKTKKQSRMSRSSHPHKAGEAAVRPDRHNLGCHLLEQRLAPTNGSASGRRLRPAEGSRGTVRPLPPWPTNMQL